MNVRYVCDFSPLWSVQADKTAASSPPSVSLLNLKFSHDGLCEKVHIVKVACPFEIILGGAVGE